MLWQFVLQPHSCFHALSKNMFMSSKAHVKTVGGSSAIVQVMKAQFVQPDPFCQRIMCPPLCHGLCSVGLHQLCACRHVCDERWDNVTRSIKLQAAVGLPRPETLKQPTWCHLKPHRIASIVQRVPRDRPENVLLLFMGTHAAEHPQEASGQLLSQQMTEVYRGHIVLSTGEKIGVSTGGMLEYEQHMAVLEAAAEAGDKPAGSHESAPALDAQSSHAQPAEAPRPRRKGEAPSGARPAVEDSKSSEERVLSKGRRSAPGAHKATKGVDSQHRARRR